MNRLEKGLEGVATYVHNNKWKTLGYAAAFMAAVELAPVASIFAPRIPRSIAHYYNQNSIQSYLLSNKGQLEKQIEDTFDIKVRSVPLEFYPNLRGVRMRYDQERGVIMASTVVVAPFLDAKQYDQSWFSYLLPKDTIAGNYIHEVGHDMVHQMRKKLKAEGKMHLSHMFEGEYTMADAILDEGIATYIQIKSGQTDNVFEHGDNFTPSLFSNMNYYDTYPLGLRAVSPILDKLGLERGIIRMLSESIITEKEVKNPEAYSQRILNSAIN